MHTRPRVCRFTMQKVRATLSTILPYGHIAMRSPGDASIGPLTATRVLSRVLSGCHGAHHPAILRVLPRVLIYDVYKRRRLRRQQGCLVLLELPLACCGALGALSRRSSRLRGLASCVLRATSDGRRRYTAARHDSARVAQRIPASSACLPSSARSCTGSMPASRAALMSA
jgi:hypothetical protein